MTIEFYKAKRNIERHKRNEEIADMLEDVDAEKAVLGAIIAETGRTEICGIEYCLQKRNLLNEYDKAGEAADALLNRRPK